MSLHVRLPLILALSALTLTPPSFARQQPGPARDLASELQKVGEIQERVKDLHPAFRKLFPIAVVSDKTFHVYEPDAGGHYKLAATAPDKMNVPVGIRAAMPLDFWGNRIACVVTPEAFDEVRGYVLVFHEFVHCYQWETCELQLKEKLGVYRRAMERKDYMWELQYKFPYASDAFSQAYSAMLAALGRGDAATLAGLRGQLKSNLAGDDWDYMTWQEWKEGLARYLENRIGARLGQPANRAGAATPFSRVTFYAGGEAVIRALMRSHPGIEQDVERLYRAIAER